MIKRIRNVTMTSTLSIKCLALQNVIFSSFPKEKAYLVSTLTKGIQVSVKRTQNDHIHEGLTLQGACKHARSSLSPNHGGD